MINFIEYHDLIAVNNNLNVNKKDLKLLLVVDYKFFSIPHYNEITLIVKKKLVYSNFRAYFFLYILFCAS